MNLMPYDDDIGADDLLAGAVDGALVAANAYANAKLAYLMAANEHDVNAANREMKALEMQLQIATRRIDNVNAGTARMNAIANQDRVDMLKAEAANEATATANIKRFAAKVLTPPATSTGTEEGEQQKDTEDISFIGRGKDGKDYNVVGRLSPEATAQQNNTELAIFEQLWDAGDKQGAMTRLLKVLDEQQADEILEAYAHHFTPKQLAAIKLEKAGFNPDAKMPEKTEDNTQLIADIEAEMKALNEKEEKSEEDILRLDTLQRQRDDAKGRETFAQPGLNKLREEERRQANVQEAIDAIDHTIDWYRSIQKQAGQPVDNNYINHLLEEKRRLEQQKAGLTPSDPYDPADAKTSSEPTEYVNDWLKKNDLTPLPDPEHAAAFNQIAQMLENKEEMTDANRDAILENQYGLLALGSTHKAAEALSAALGLNNTLMQRAKGLGIDGLEYIAIADAVQNQLGAIRGAGPEAAIIGGIEYMAENMEPGPDRRGKAAQAVVFAGLSEAGLKPENVALFSRFVPFVGGAASGNKWIHLEAEYDRLAQNAEMGDTVPFAEYFIMNARDFGKADIQKTLNRAASQFGTGFALRTSLEELKKLGYEGGTRWTEIEVDVKEWFGKATEKATKDGNKLRLNELENTYKLFTMALQNAQSGQTSTDQEYARIRGQIGGVGLDLELSMDRANAMMLVGYTDFNRGLNSFYGSAFDKRFSQEERDDAFFNVSSAELPEISGNEIYQRAKGRKVAPTSPGVPVKTTEEIFKEWQKSDASEPQHSLPLAERKKPLPEEYISNMGGELLETDTPADLREIIDATLTDKRGYTQEVRDDAYNRLLPYLKSGLTDTELQIIDGLDPDAGRRLRNAR